MTQGCVTVEPVLALGRFQVTVAGLCTGALPTALIQSSSGIMAVTVGLVDADFDLEQAPGVILEQHRDYLDGSTPINALGELSTGSHMLWHHNVHLGIQGWGQIGVVIAVLAGSYGELTFFHGSSAINVCTCCDPSHFAVGKEPLLCILAGTLRRSAKQWGYHWFASPCWWVWWACQVGWPSF